MLILMQPTIINILQQRRNNVYVLMMCEELQRDTVSRTVSIQCTHARTSCCCLGDLSLQLTLLSSTDTQKQVAGFLQPLSHVYQCKLDKEGIKEQRKEQGKEGRKEQGR